MRSWLVFIDIHPHMRRRRMRRFVPRRQVTAGVRNKTRRLRGPGDIPESRKNKLDLFDRKTGLGRSEPHIGRQLVLRQAADDPTDIGEANSLPQQINQISVTKGLWRDLVGATDGLRKTA